jgi:23S rRNA (guanosine2251-2'-O)-methyltransferase
MNLGAIIRSAACFGISTVVLPERRSAGLTATAQKAASGAVDRVGVVEVVNLNQTIMKLKEKGFWVYGMDMGGKPLPQVDFTLPAFIIIGSEGEGLHQKTGEHCDEIVSIPQKGGVESLNASNAAAVVFYELSKKI